jgi:hypothetical protein
VVRYGSPRSPLLPFASLATVRWHDGESVGDGHRKGQFRALKDVGGDMIDKGVFTQSTAR